MTVGELLYTSRDEVKLYVEPRRRELDLAFEFDLCAWNFGPGGRFDQGHHTVQDLKRIICRTWNGLRSGETAWQAFFLESHDTARCVTRFGNGKPEHSAAIAKLLAVLSTTLCGTLFVYQGQEIGMENHTADPIESFDDINTINAIRTIERSRHECSQPGVTIDMSDVHEQVRLKARDHTRSAIPWKHGEPNAGFSTTTGPLWKPMNSNTDRIDVASQMSASNSVLSFWRDMIEFRRIFAETIVFGTFDAVDDTLSEGPIFAYIRPGTSHKGPIKVDILVVLNLTAEDHVPFALPYFEGAKLARLIDTRCEGGFIADASDVSGGLVHLGPYQALVFFIVKETAASLHTDP
ncbi:hypothetical protein LTR95_005692 [Oleoguttula sp. CCFEE 5521]